jgi:hypothetical protein
VNKAEGTYLGKVARLGCVVCRVLVEREGLEYEPPDAFLQMTVIHHFRHGEGRCRAENWLAIPLCVMDHTGSQGIHGNRSRMTNLKLTENDLLAMTIELYHLTYGI